MLARLLRPWDRDKLVRTCVQTMSRYAAAHASPKGPGDARPTALGIVEDEDLIGKLQGKVFLVTGCSSGIGVETARALHATGGDVYVTARDQAKGQAVLDDIKATSQGKGKLHLLELELDSLQSVRKLVQDFQIHSKQLHVLVNNAGVMASPESKTKDGFELQFGTNHLGHFLLFQLLKPALLASTTPDFNSRVVSVASTGHRVSTVLLDDLDFAKSGYNPWKAYGQAKTANIWFALELERRYGPQGVHSTALHPGGIWTPLQRHVPELMEKYGNDPAIQAHMKSPEQGAATSVWAAIGREWEGKGGKYLEDCGIGELYQGGGPATGGYEAHAYDAEGAKKLWEVSLELVGLKDKVEGLS